MDIRRAKKGDIDGIIKLLKQVLEVHAKLRPDLFIEGSTKYDEVELEGMLSNDDAPIYVAADENDDVMGYVFCIIENQSYSNEMVQYKSIYIDDLCVDESLRGKGIGAALFEHVKIEAKNMGCKAITLNLWKGNDTAARFYEELGFKERKRNMEYKL